MKKFLTILFSILAFALLVVLIYFFSIPKDSRAFEGKYYLYQTIVTDYHDEENKTETKSEFEIDENSYLSLDRSNNIFAENITEIPFEDGKSYIYEIKGTKLKIKLDEKTKFEGFYADGHIIIIIDDKDNKVATEYYYKKI